MAKKEAQRTYNMTDPELCMFTSNLCLHLERDLADLSKFGMTQLLIDDLRSLGNAFEVFPNDDAYLGDVMIAVDAKEGLAEQVRETIRDMLVRVESKWGVDSGEYKNLSAKGMNKLTDKELLTTARQVHSKCTDYLTDLAVYGLTQVMLDDFATLNENFELAMNDVDEKKTIRDKKTYERVDKGNEIYDFVVTYCDMGKRTFVKSDPARYDEYVIYSDSPELPGKITGLAYDSLTGTLTWTGNPDALVYEVQFAPDLPGPIFTEIYEGPATSYIYDPGGPDNYLFRVRGKNENGSGEWSDVLTVVRP